MEHALLIDFGSTFTKVTVADLLREEIVAAAQAPTTAATDIMAGLGTAMAGLRDTLHFPPEEYEIKLACSSAAGGLRMVAIGLVPQLTAEAAKMAALGAGAKVLGTFSFKLDECDMEDIRALRPEIILLSGGTDGGEGETIVHNAEMLAHSGIAAPIVVAGNRVACGKVKRLLEGAGLEVAVTENVLPRLDLVNTEPARAAIRDIFMRRIVNAKGLNRAEGFADAVVMPTPAAVLHAAALLSEGARGEKGIGNLLVIDPGGATTDVHSVTDGFSLRTGVQIKGLPEPRRKRTVEGDLGLRHSALAMFETVNPLRVLRHMPRQCGYEQLEAFVRRLADEPSRLPDTSFARDVDLALARTAVDVATERHAGILREFYGPMGTSLVQYGRDLSEVNWVVGTGGALVNSEAPRAILEACRQTDPMVLKPAAPKFLLDKRYILSAMGLLATRRPSEALRIMKKYMVEI